MENSSTTEWFDCTAMILRIPKNISAQAKKTNQQKKKTQQLVEYYYIKKAYLLVMAK